MNVSRRQFLGAAGATAGSLVASRLLLPRVAHALSASPTNQRILVLIQLMGGNDGLNTVVPYADPLYRRARPTLALGPSELLRIDDKLAFHGAMVRLRELFDQGQVSVVHGVGYPQHSRSHFAATAVWQAGRLDPERDGSGWLGRTCSARSLLRGHGPIAVSLGQGGLSAALLSDQGLVPALVSFDSFSAHSDPRYGANAPCLQAALADLYQRRASSTGAKFVSDVGRTAFETSELFRSVEAGYTSSVDYPSGEFGDQLRLVGQLMCGDTGTRLFHVWLRDFDTHANQRYLHHKLLGLLSDGIAALIRDARAHGKEEQLLIMTYSEFGRRVAENASAGTDHGAAGPVLLVGKRVAGGLHGIAPDLAHLNDGDLTHQIDFRSVYASVLHDWLGVDPVALLGAPFPAIPLLR